MNTLDKLILKNHIKRILKVNKRHHKKRNILFLDFDGVINIGNDYKNNRFNEYANKECINNLNQLCIQFNLDIVISSTHRFSGIEYCRKYLYDSGLDKNINIIDITPIDGLRHRYLEIYDYIKTSKEIVKFLIIDDIYMDPLHKYAVMTDYDTGFNADALTMAIKKFLKN